MRVRQFRERRDRPRDLLEGALVEHAVDVVVVVVDEQHAAAIAVLAQRAPLEVGEAHGEMAGEERERILEQLGASRAAR